MNIFKKILAGFLIAIGGYAFLKVGGIVGAFLFSFGIICVVNLQTPLYTGIAGTDEKFWTKIEVLVYNIIGAGIGAWLMHFTYDSVVLNNISPIIFNKLMSPLYVTLSKAIMCGVIVDISVFLAKRDNSVIPLLIGIPTFIMCGFNHSIADAFYFGIENNLILNYGIWKPLLYYLIVVVGNYIGCNIRQVCTKDNIFNNLFKKV